MITVMLVLATTGVTYWFVARRWFAQWGTSAADRDRAMAGDVIVPGPTYSATLAITIAARPEDIWPWLIQMGYRRGGLYSYDWLDRLFGYLDRPSANRVLPLFQHLEVGDEIPIGRAGGFPVRTIEPYRALVLGGEIEGVSWVWQFGLYPLDASTTRFVSRNQVRTRGSLAQWFLMRAIEPAAFLMTRRMLIGLKLRAEAIAAARLISRSQREISANRPAGISATHAVSSGNPPDFRQSTLVSESSTAQSSVTPPAKLRSDHLRA